MESNDINIGNPNIYIFKILSTYKNHCLSDLPSYNSILPSRFQIEIDVKTIIIGHVFIQTKFCVWGREGTTFCFG